MFNKDLFLSLCGKYGVELSDAVIEPMIRDGNQTHAILSEDINRIFSPYQTFFEYSDNRVKSKVNNYLSYLNEDFATAC